MDEAGNQLSVFNRKGSRPFTLEEMQRLYLAPGYAGHGSSATSPWRATNAPAGSRNPRDATTGDAGAEQAVASYHWEALTFYTIDRRTV